MRWVVKFDSIGRGRKSWEKAFSRNPSDADIYRELLRSKAITSRDVTIEWDDDDHCWTISAGGLVVAGTITVKGER